MFTRRIAVSLAVFFASVLLTIPTRAQDATRISGSVVDRFGEPLSGAHVMLSMDGRSIAGAVTDPDGRFELLASSLGVYTLRASFIGFRDRELEVEIEGKAIALAPIVLDDRVLPADDVVVEARRVQPRLSPVTYSNLTARDLATLPEMKDLPVLLATLPSITFHSENGNGIGYSTMRMRGFDQRRIAIAINGIPQNDPEDFNVFWINFFDIQGAVDDIQVQRGANGAMYGPAGIAGAVNIIARPYRPDPFVRVEAGYGSYSTRRMTVEANSGTFGDGLTAFARLSRLTTDGYRRHSWSRFTRFFAGVERSTERSRLTLQSYGGPQRDGLAFSGIPQAANEEPVPDGFGGEIDRRHNPSATSQDVESFHQPHIELLHQWQASDALSFEQAVFWVKGEGYFDFNGTFRSANYLRLPDDYREMTEAERQLPLFITAVDASLLFRAYLDQWQVGWLPRLHAEHPLGRTEVGLEARLHRSQRWGRIQEATGIPAEMVGSEADDRAYQFHGEKAIGSAFISHTARPHERVAVQADVQFTHRRYRIFDEAYFGNEFSTGFSFINPRLGITVNPERAVSGYVSAAIANREPRLKTIYDGEEAGAGFQPQFEREDGGTFDYSAPLVRPERLYNTEVGLRLTGSRSRLSVNVFGMWFEDEIVPSGGLDQFGVARTGNAERTRHIGLEVDGEVRIAPGLDLSGNVTLSRNRFIRFDEFVPTENGYEGVRRDGNPIAGFPEQTAYVAARYTRSGWTLTTGSRLAGKQFIDNSANEETAVDPYALVDASLQYRMPASSYLHGLSLRIDMNNVLDQKVLLYGNVGPLGPQYFPAATRHVFFGATYEIR